MKTTTNESPRELEEAWDESDAEVRRALCLFGNLTPDETKEVGLIIYGNTCDCMAYAPDVRATAFALLGLSRQQLEQALKLIHAYPVCCGE